RRPDAWTAAAMSRAWKRCSATGCWRRCCAAPGSIRRGFATGWRRRRGGSTIAPPATTSATGSSFGTRRSLGKVEPDREAGPVVGERHAGAVAMRDGPHQAEAEPVARRATARLEPYKPIEYA